MYSGVLTFYIRRGQGAIGVDGVGVVWYGIVVFNVPLDTL